jgi:SAM-dependent methyltransferase
VGAPTPETLAPLQALLGDLTLLPDLDALAAAPPGTVDLLLLLGQLDTADDPPGLLRVLGHLLAPGALLMGVVPGNNSLPALRHAMFAADAAGGAGMAPRVHPRLEASSLAGLLSAAGFVDPVVDIDRVRLRYRRFDDLVADLRGMAATNVLQQRSRRPLGRSALQAARTSFAELGDERGTVETIELIHFTAWTAEQRG